MSPLKVLGRGYAIARRSGGALIRSAADVAEGDQMSIRVADGEIGCRVERTEYRKDVLRNGGK